MKFIFKTINKILPESSEDILVGAILFFLIPISLFLFTNLFDMKLLLNNTLESSTIEMKGDFIFDYHPAYGSTIPNAYFYHDNKKYMFKCPKKINNKICTSIMNRSLTEETNCKIKFVIFSIQEKNKTYEGFPISLECNEKNIKGVDNPEKHFRKNRLTFLIIKVIKYSYFLYIILFLLKSIIIFKNKGAENY